MICESKKVAKLVQALEMPNEKYERLFGNPRTKKEDIKNNKNLVNSYAQVNPAPELEQSKMKKTKENANFEDGDDEVKLSLIRSHEKESAMNIKKSKKKKDGEEYLQSNLLSTYDQFKNTTVNPRRDIEQEIDAEYDRHPKPQTQMEVGEEHLLQKLKNHIVVCGIHSSIQHFILPLRAKYLQNQQQDIVIITPVQTIPTSIWDTISRFPRIYLVNGSPLLVEVLRKAQIHKADKAVILGHDPTTNKINEMSEEMLDAQSIFIYKAIQKCNPRLQILTELSFSSNIDFLLKNSGQQIEHHFQTLFAAGEVYISSIIDTLTAQAFYNPNIVTILQQLLVGRCDSFHRDFEKILMRHFGDKIS
jgi:hypothetical protein